MSSDPFIVALFVIAPLVVCAFRCGSRCPRATLIRSFTFDHSIMAARTAMNTLKSLHTSLVQLKSTLDQISADPSGLTTAENEELGIITALERDIQDHCLQLHDHVKTIVDSKQWANMMSQEEEEVAQDEEEVKSEHSFQTNAPDQDASWTAVDFSAQTPPLTTVVSASQRAFAASQTMHGGPSSSGQSAPVVIRPNPSRDIRYTQTTQEKGPTSTWRKGYVGGKGPSLWAHSTVPSYHVNPADQLFTRPQQHGFKGSKMGKERQIPQGDKSRNIVDHWAMPDEDLQYNVAFAEKWQEGPSWTTNDFSEGYKLHVKNLPANISKESFLGAIYKERADRWGPSSFANPIRTDLWSSADRSTSQAMLCMNTANDAACIFQISWKFSAADPRHPERALHITVGWGTVS